MDCKAGNVMFGMVLRREGNKKTFDFMTHFQKVIDILDDGVS